MRKICYKQATFTRKKNVESDRLICNVHKRFGALGWYGYLAARVESRFSWHFLSNFPSFENTLSAFSYSSFVLLYQDCLFIACTTGLEVSCDSDQTRPFTVESLEDKVRSGSPAASGVFQIVAVLLLSNRRWRERPVLEKTKLN